MNMTDMTDQELYRLSAEGSEDAFSELLKRNESMAYNVAYSILRDREDAFDAAQEALLRVWRSAGKYKGRCAVKSWIYGIAKNAALDAARAKRSHMTASLDEIADAADSAEEEASRRDDIENVRAAISMLPEHYREAIELRELYDMSYEEISEAAGIPIGTVKSRLARAHEALRAILCEKFGYGGTNRGGDQSKEMK